MKKRILAVILLAVFCAAVSAQGAYAMEKCKMCKGASGGMRKADGNEFYKTAHLAIMNKEELGLSDAQVKKIKDIKIGLKKDMIKRDAEIQTLMVDIKVLMWEYPFDTAGLNQLVAQKYEMKKDKAMAMVAAYDKLNGVLNKGQQEMVGKMLKEKGHR